MLRVENSIEFNLGWNFQLKELIEEYDDGTCDDGGSGPEGRHVRIENKNFFFSCKKNAQVKSRGC